MTTVSTTAVSRFFRGLTAIPGFLAGPILAKELRVSSRRRRNFVLRGGYVAALLVLVLLVWVNTVDTRNTDNLADFINSMSEAGKALIAGIAWFQFAALQIVALVMLSTSISEEVYAKTLGVLMTTPIRSFQIVVGKLFSKIFQLLLLLALSLPLLGVLRVFGGVPWDYIVATVCVTFTSVLVVASVTMFFSICFRHAFVTILVSFGTLAVLYAVLPMIFGLLAAAVSLYKNRWLAETLGLVFLHSNQFTTMGLATITMMNPGGFFGGPSFFEWWINCLVSLGISGVVLTACVAMVRRVGLRMVAGATRAGPTAPPAQAELQPAAPPAALPAPAPPGPDGAPPPVQAPPPATPRPTAAATGRVRAITGSPIVWRELRPKLKRGVLYWILLAVGTLLIPLIYLLTLAAEADAFTDNDTHAVYLVIYTILAAIVTSVYAATNITSEKEARSWELLLCTPMTDWHILLGKLVGVLRRCLPIWLLPVGHILLFTLVGCCYPGMGPMYLLTVLGTVALLGGGGLYFGARFRRTTTAVMMNIALGLGLWAVGPICVSALMTPSWARTQSRPLEDLVQAAFVDANPVYQAAMLGQGSTGREMHYWDPDSEYRGRNRADNPTFRWQTIKTYTYADAMAYMLLIAAVYVAVAGLLSWRAKCQFRKRWF